MGKKLGNAVSRNKIKRQVRAIADEVFNFRETYDAVLIIRPVFLKHSFHENLKELQKLKSVVDKKYGKENT